MKILHLDCETAPNICYTWGLFNQNLSLDKIIEPGYTLCWSAKWDNAPEIMFDSVHKSGMGDMLGRMWALLDEADAVVHYNGTRFDIPTLNREFVKYNLPVPSPYQQIDLYRVVRSTFRFASNKLDWVCRELGLGAKVHHKGMSLWSDCMAGDSKAWKTMERYNKQDVRLLPKLYRRLLPWIRVHPNHGLYVDASSPVCPNCGSKHIIKRGSVVTSTQRYLRYHCKGCGKWARGKIGTVSRVNSAKILRGIS